MVLYKFSNDDLDVKFNIILNSYFKNVPKKKQKVIEYIFFKYKHYCEKEYYLYLSFLYLHVYFKIIDIDNQIITSKDRVFIDQLFLLLEFEMNWKPRQYIQTLLNMDINIFRLKIITKYIILYNCKKFWKVIPNLDMYYRSLWWIIPLLSFKEFPKIWSFLEDIYFEKIYPEEYKWAKNYYLKQSRKISVLWNFMIDIMIDISTILKDLWIYWITEVRRKSLFSYYNKILKKKWSKISDIVWLRLILTNEKSLERFRKEFEKQFVIEKIKDYIKKPKPNWYRSLHYSFVYVHSNYNIEVELQLRTTEMDNEIRNSWNICHFIYSKNTGKWAPIFTEVRQWLDYLSKQQSCWNY